MRVLFYFSGAEHLGIEALSAHLKKHGHMVDLIFDPALGSNHFLNLPFLNKIINEKMVIAKAKRFSPDIVAFSIITNEYNRCIRIANKLKRILRVPIIAGGIHPTSLPEEVIKNDCFDILCIGEGEGAFVELLKKLEEKRGINKIKNLWVKNDLGKIHRNEPRPLIKDLDDLPMPDKSLFAKYGVLTSRIMVMTGRGCPYQCTFCVNSFRKTLYQGQKYLRRKSVDKTIAELIYLKKTYEPKAFRFEDDVFAYDLQWLRSFRIKYVTQVKLPFHCYITPTTATEKIVRELKLCGCTSVSMGIQAGNERLRRKILHRNHSNKQIIKAANIIHKYGIKLNTEYIFGFPKETPSQMWESLELNEKLNPHNTASFIFYPFPKTELAEFCLREGYLTRGKYELVKRGMGSYHTFSPIEHPFKEDVFKFNSVLPLFARSPKIVKKGLKHVLKMKYGLIHKIIYGISIPLLDFDEFLVRLKQMPILIRNTRKVFLKSRGT